MFEKAPSVILSLGLGVDSAAILLRWLEDPSSRDFDLDDLCVLTAQTGNEWESTRDLVETHLLPRMREHHVRFIQVARTGASQRDGVTVLSDTREPRELHIEGAYSLYDELIAAGTVPQVASGQRRCSAKAKAFPLDYVIEQLTGGRPFRHVMGFEATETRRAERDTSYSTVARTSEYPLIEWGWDRAACEAYIQTVTGAAWAKSACQFCPFAFTSKAGLAKVLLRYRAEPEAAMKTLYLEHVSLALNPNISLFSSSRAIDEMRNGGLEDLVETFASSLEGVEHALYEVRRIVNPKKADRTAKGHTWRSVRTLSTGTRAEQLAELHAAAAVEGLDVETDDLHSRVWLQHRSGQLPDLERMLVVAPAGVANKERTSFSARWNELTADVLPLFA